MRISHLGEFGLIERIRKKNRRLSGNSSVKVGIGDDCAVVESKKGKFLLLTTDTLIENIHFSRRYFSFLDIGYKSLAVNLSDIAAMGGVPLYCLISAGLPIETDIKNVDDFYRGIATLASKFDVKIIGGDTTESPGGIVVSITVIGEAISGKGILRSGACPGDAVFATGPFGESAAGLLILQKNLSGCRHFVKKHLRPYPKIEEGLFIARSKLATSMIDSSDGLDSSIRFICQESNVGCEIYLDKIPVSKYLKVFSSRRSISAIQYALFGGEEYELLFTVPYNKKEFFEKKFHYIGKITKSKKIKYIDSNNKEINFKKYGYDHFKK
ncbi:MAG: thiamine-phosphate kinase [Elusimicrobia bacterium]|nr:thiamine-phosphate kinase [Elusimicrobiota bacterium]